VPGKLCAVSLSWMLVFSLSLKAISPHAAPQKGRITGPRLSAATNVNPAQYVNPFIGTDRGTAQEFIGGGAGGNTFPGATVPFGMVQWSPDTASSFSQEESGSYVYRDDAIRGFSLTHLSGPGCPVYADVPFMPFKGEVRVSPASGPDAYMAKFSHEHEKAAPGHYEVALDSGIEVELTATTRTGFGTFTYPSATGASLLIDVGRNATGVTDAALMFTGDRQVSGSVMSGRFCGTRNQYKLYFFAEFNRPFKSFGTWQGASIRRGERAVKGAKTGGYVTFDTSANQLVQVKVGLSYVSVKNAELNLRAENKGGDFAAVRDAARARWNQMLGRIEVGGGTMAEKQVFYTALYHALLHPNVFSDVNGEYMGFDNRVHLARGYTQYANYSGWDIYRSEVQLLALLFPSEASDMMQSLVMDATQGGGLPKWSVANDESGVMVGDPSVPIIASAYAFGAKNFDTGAALKAMLKGATDPDARSKTYTQRGALGEYLKYGYITIENEVWGSSATTLEYTTADFCIAQFAAALGDRTNYQTFMRRAQYWKNMLDRETGLIHPRDARGAFIGGIDPQTKEFTNRLPWDPTKENGFVEGNAVQYTWMIPYNMRALFDSIGGNERVVKKLDAFFTELNAGPHRPYFYIGNEPVFGVPWAYNFAGAPWRTQSVVRRVMTELFTNQPGGLPGNDDLGATSSWYVFAALGLYPSIPGVGGFTLNSPLFPDIKIHLRGGKRLKIEGIGAHANTPFVQELGLDGRPYESTWLPLATVAKGATLRFKLGQAPNKNWANKPSAAPPSFDDGMAQ
jgi:predicted alpha-1,2-mannosidase